MSQKRQQGEEGTSFGDKRSKKSSSFRRASTTPLMASSSFNKIRKCMVHTPTVDLGIQYGMPGGRYDEVEEKINNFSKSL